MNKQLSRITRAVILALAFLFALIATFFILNFAGYIADTVLPHKMTAALVCIGGAILALPCFSILLMALKLPPAIASDGIFTKKTAALIARISLILFIDCVLFLIAVCALLCIGELLVSPLLALVDLIGFALAFLLFVLSDYIKRAAILKEEVDATL